MKNNDSFAKQIVSLITMGDCIWDNSEISHRYV